VCLPLADLGRDGAIDKHQLEGSLAASADFFAERLRDHTLERRGEHGANLRLAVRRKLIDDAING
jgi:hypothetical protein